MAPRERTHHNHAWAEKLEDWRYRYQQRGRIYRALYLMSGVVVLLCGLAMLVLPGPALVVIPIGLAMLAMEFAWADWMLGHALRQADRAQQKAREATRRQQILGALGTAAAVAAAITAWMLWEIPVIPG